jgi:hypothetical protein
MRCQERGKAGGHDETHVGALDGSELGDGLDESRHFAGELDDAPSERRELEPRGAALDEPSADRSLQARETTPDRGVLDPQAAGGSGQAPGLCRAQEVVHRFGERQQRGDVSCRPAALRS